jgi:hypothetical protein
MERRNAENYEQTAQTIQRPKPESAANALGSMVLSFIVFESIFSGMGALGGTSVLGSSESFAHATAELAGVNNLASLGYGEERGA